MSWIVVCSVNGHPWLIIELKTECELIWIFSFIQTRGIMGHGNLSPSVVDRAEDNPACDIRASDVSLPMCPSECMPADHV